MKSSGGDGVGDRGRRSAFKNSGAPPRPEQISPADRQLGGGKARTGSSSAASRRLNRETASEVHKHTEINIHAGAGGPLMGESIQLFSFLSKTSRWVEKEKVSGELQTARGIKEKARMFLVKVEQSSWKVPAAAH